MPEHERPMAEIIAASSTVAELLDNVERAGGIKRSDGKSQDLKWIRDQVNFTSDIDVHAIRILSNNADRMIFAAVTKTDGFRQKLRELFMKELADKLEELAGLN